MDFAWYVYDRSNDCFKYYGISNTNDKTNTLNKATMLYNLQSTVTCIFLFNAYFCYRYCFCFKNGETGSEGYIFIVEHHVRFFLGGL